MLRIATSSLARLARLAPLAAIVVAVACSAFDDPVVGPVAQSGPVGPLLTSSIDAFVGDTVNLAPEIELVSRSERGVCTTQNPTVATVLDGTILMVANARGDVVVDCTRILYREPWLDQDGTLGKDRDRVAYHIAVHVQERDTGVGGDAPAER
jgi:hypothetical protein